MNENIVRLLIVASLSLLWIVSAHPAAGTEPDRASVQAEAPDGDPERTKVQESKGMLLKRMEYFFQDRRGPDGVIPLHARSRALEEIEKNIQAGRLGRLPEAMPGDIWLPIGPAPLYDGTVAYTGRVISMAVHPTDPNTVYAGGAQGGIWKTTDGGVNWTPIFDSANSLAVGALAFDPNDPTGNTLYAGTGEAHFSCDSYFGDGIYRTTDGGATWTPLGQAYLSTSSISALIVDPGIPTTLYCSNTYGTGGFLCYGPWVTCGVWKSTDGGTVWNRILDATTTGGSNAYATDLIMDPVNPNVLYAGIDGSGIWKTMDGGSSWGQLTTGLPSTNVGRIDLTVDPNSAAVLFCVIEDTSTGRPLGIYGSVDGGASWSSLTMPSGSCQYWTLSDICTYSGYSWGTCWYNLYIEMGPSGDLWVGGIGLWRSSDGGNTWSNVCPATVHVDHHCAAFDPAGAVWIGNDGGIFTSSDGGATWTNRNDGVAMTQFYPGATLHPMRPDFAIAGSQDNGTNKFDISTSWTHLYGGDGAFTAIDSTNPDMTWYVSSQNLNIQKTTNGGASFFSAVTGLTDANTGNAAFIAPFAMCPSMSNVLVAGSDNAWLTLNSAANWSSNSPDPLEPSGSQIRSIAFDPQDAACLTYFVGTANGKVFRTTDQGMSWSDISSGGSNPLPGFPFGLSDIAVDPTNPNTVYVALSGFGGSHLYKSTDALNPTPNWYASDAGIPNTPANAVLVDPTDNMTVYLGTDVGIFRSLDGAVSWQYFMLNHPNVAVYDLVAELNTMSVYSFTHGRGAWRLDLSVPGEVGKYASGHLKIADNAGSMDMTWGQPGGTCFVWDYSIYEGDLNVLTSTGTYNHDTQVACHVSTTNYSMPMDSPPAGSVFYYLVVSNDFSTEGIYGTDSSGTQRPQTPAACLLTQDTTPCN